MASVIELALQLDRLSKALPMPRGFSLGDTMHEYQRALCPLPVLILQQAVDMIIDGRVERKSNTFPRVGEIAQLCAKLNGEEEKATTKLARGPEQKMYRYKLPKSKILASDITRDKAKQMADNGAVPRKCIWCPGPIGNAAYGDLYAPDPDWQPAVPVE